MDAPKTATLTVEHAVANMGLSILKSLPVGSRMAAKKKAPRNDDFESFAANNSRVYQPTASFLQLSN